MKSNFHNKNSKYLQYCPILQPKLKQASMINGKLIETPIFDNVSDNKFTFISRCLEHLKTLKF